jgi:hypothetical protein
MNKNKSIGIKIFAVIYVSIGLICLYLSLLPIIWRVAGDPRLEWLIGDAYTGNYMSSAEIWFSIGLFVAFATAFIASGVLLLRLNVWGCWLPLPFSIFASIFGCYILIPLIIVHIIYFLNPKIKKQFQENGHMTKQSLRSEKFEGEKMNKKKYLVILIIGFVLGVVIASILLKNNNQSSKDKLGFDDFRYTEEPNNDANSFKSVINLVDSEEAFVVIEAGSNQNVRHDSEIYVLRNGKRIAKLSIVQTREDVSAAEPIPKSDIYKIKKWDNVLIINR